MEIDRASSANEYWTAYQSTLPSIYYTPMSTSTLKSSSSSNTRKNTSGMIKDKVKHTARYV